MITPDDNGYARVKRWREKNRGYVNLKQREYRKRKKGGAEGSSDLATERPEGKGQVSPDKSASPFSVEKKEVGGFKLNMIVMPKEAVQDEPVMPVGKPKVFRDDFGNQLNEAQWNRWQEIKRKAKEKGYVKDEYSQ